MQCALHMGKVWSWASGCELSSQSAIQAQKKSVISTSKKMCHALLGVDDLEANGAEEDLLDLVMLRLRLADGLDLSSVSARFGREKAEAVYRSLKKHIDKGLVQENNRVVRLQDPRGFLVSNSIISDIFVAVDRM
jgi:coproporphyrinogen III oxidase-like Fe-S oxidoreductase